MNSRNNLGIFDDIIRSCKFNKKLIENVFLITEYFKDANVDFFKQNSSLKQFISVK